MATYNLAAGDEAAHAKTMVAATEDTVNFVEAVSDVEIVIHSAPAAIYVTLDNVAATVAGARTFVIPPVIGQFRRLRVPKRETATTIRLISAGAPVYSVSKVPPLTAPAANQ